MSMFLLLFKSFIPFLDTSFLKCKPMQCNQFIYQPKIKSQNENY